MIDDEKIQAMSHKMGQLRQLLNERLIGQEQTVHHVLIALLSNGHVILEGVPGLGKTLLVRVLANCFGGQFKRIQFTPDLMPSDITGHAVYDLNTKSFRLHKGPIFTNLLLADEINRAPAKSQSALLEVMQERQVTLEGKSIEVSRPFMVLATQNPLEQEGTYPLPEAALDRFFMKVIMDYPEQEDEVTLTKLIAGGEAKKDLLDIEQAVISAADLIEFQQAMEAITTDDKIIDYAVRIVRQTRQYASIYRGAGSRACIDLVKCAKAQAFLSGRNYVLPDDVKTAVLPVMRHRIALTPDIQISGQTADHVLQQLLDTIEAPRS